MNNGWLKLHRSLLEWEWYSDATTFRLFMHILLKANFKKSRFQGFDVPVGGFVSSAKSLAAETGLTNSQVRTSLSKLERTKEIAINTTNKFSIISVVKWYEYQSDDNQIAIKSQSSDKQIATEEEGKKERREEGNLINPKTSFGDAFDAFWELYPCRKNRNLSRARYLRIAEQKGSEFIDTCLRQDLANGTITDDHPASIWLDDFFNDGRANAFTETDNT